MKIFAIKSSNNFYEPITRRVSFGVRHKQSQTPDTFEKAQKPAEFYTLSELAHSGQNKHIQELLKKPEYNIEALKQMLTMQDEDGRTPLHKAVRGANFENILGCSQGELEEFTSGDKEARKNLLEVEAIRKNIKWQPQYLLTIRTMLQPFENDPETLKKVLTVHDCERQTPLSEAVSRNAVNVRTMLSLLDAYPEILKEMLLDKDYGKQTLLHVLANQPGKHEPISELIEPFENDIESLKELLMTQDWQGNTPLHLAIKRAGTDPRTVKTLLEPFKNNPKALRELLTVKNKGDRAPFELITYYNDDKVSQVVESYIKIVVDADKN